MYPPPPPRPRKKTTKTLENKTLRNRQVQKKKRKKKNSDYKKKNKISRYHLTFTRHFVFLLTNLWLRKLILFLFLFLLIFMNTSEQHTYTSSEHFQLGRRRNHACPGQWKFSYPGRELNSRPSEYYMFIGRSNHWTGWSRVRFLPGAWRFPFSWASMVSPPSKLKMFTGNVCVLLTSVSLKLSFRSPAEKKQTGTNKRTLFCNYLNAINRPGFWCFSHK